MKSAADECSPTLTLTLTLSFMPSGYAGGRGDQKRGFPPLPLAYPKGHEGEADAQRRVRVVSTLVP